MNRDLDWINRIDFSNKTETIKTILAEFKGWAPEITALLTESDSNIVARKSMLYLTNIAGNLSQASL